MGMAQQAVRARLIEIRDGGSAWDAVDSLIPTCGRYPAFGPGLCWVHP